MKGRRGKGDPWAVARSQAFARLELLGLPLPQARAPLVAGGVPGAAAPAKGGGRQGGPSKTELAYATEVLEPGRLRGEVVGWEHQPPPFLLAYRCTFAPDYLVRLADGVREAVDVKREGGWLHEDATIKLKFLARLHPELRCVQAFRAGPGNWRRRVIPSLEAPCPP